MKISREVGVRGCGWVCECMCVFTHVCSCVSQEGIEEREEKIEEGIGRTLEAATDG